MYAVLIAIIVTVLYGSIALFRRIFIRGSSQGGEGVWKTLWVLLFLPILFAGIEMAIEGVPDWLLEQQRSREIEKRIEESKPEITKKAVEAALKNFPTLKPGP
jgi:hypothetical protein